MGVSLTKGQKVSLSKEASSLKGMIVGLGWDVKKSLFGGNFDLDASLIACKNGVFQSKNDLVYFGNKKAFNGAIKHCGDNLTGEGDGDDEQIIVSLDDLPNDVDKLIVVVTIYRGKSKGQSFDKVQNAYVRVCESTGVEVLKFSLTDNYKGMSGMIFGEIYRHNGEWKFNPVGQGVDTDSISDITKMYSR